MYYLFIFEDIAKFMLEFIIIIIIAIIKAFFCSETINMSVSAYFFIPSSVAVITALYGTREKTLKPTINQTIPVDFYAFVEK